MGEGEGGGKVKIFPLLRFLSCAYSSDLAARQLAVEVLCVLNNYVTDTIEIKTEYQRRTRNENNVKVKAKMY